jgi:hypothetical protein
VVASDNFLFISVLSTSQSVASEALCVQTHVLTRYVRAIAAYLL